MNRRPTGPKVKCRAAAVLLALALGLPAGASAPAATPSVSAFTTRPDDPRAITVHGTGDGKTDDTAALQRALDAAANKGAGGIVFLPSGRYRISRTLFIWPAVRLFGTGPTRPVLVLGDNTPGFQKGVANMVLFPGSAPGNRDRVPVPPPTTVPFDPLIADANSGTFYTGLSNVDFEIGAGNPATAAVRAHAAQHAILSHIDFHIGSGLAGVYQVGNLAQDLRFFGGRYGILAEKTSPAWQFTLVDTVFEGQREAAIREHEAGLTLVNVTIRDAPVGIDIDEGYGDWLWGKNVRLERVARAGVVISNEANAYTQIGFENAVASDTPVFAQFRESGRTVPASGRRYRVAEFTYGLTLPGLGSPGRYETRVDARPLDSAPAVSAPAIRSLPPSDEWVSVRTLGATGDGRTDDTAAIQRAIARHRVLYFPSGRYVVSDTLRLRPDTVLIGLHPSLTQIVLPDGASAFEGVGGPKALIESARGGDAIVSGLGLFTGGVNPRATALLWKAGANSLVEDVKIQGGHGTLLADGTRFDPYNANHSGDPDPAKRWDAQYPSFWITDGGGGTFANLWSPNTYAQSGFLVTNTKTPGHVYELSNEHHLRDEIVLDGVENWEFLAPQTEEEAGEGQDTVALSVRNSRNVLFANFHGYRVTRSVKPAPAAVRLFNSGEIRFRNVHVNAESGYAFCNAGGCGTYLRASKFPFENAIEDATRKLAVREREFAVLDVPAAGTPAPPAPPSVLASVAVEKLEDGFYSISGAAVDARGKLFFVDHRFQRIYGWSKAEGLSIERDAPLDPVNLAIDRSGNIMVLSSSGPEATVYSFRPGSTNNSVTVIPPTPVASHRGALVALPGNLWNNGEFRDQYDPGTDRFTTLAELFRREIGRPKAREYVSPDGSLVLPVFRVVQQGPPDFRGWRFSDALDTYGFVAARQGERVFVSNGSEDRTYRGTVGPGGSVIALEPFANRGGESVAVAPDGRVFAANGQIFVYSPAGEEIGRIDVPARPIQLIFGGPDRRTLFILTHHALYAATP